ncbi:hypothetical protein [Chitinophaga solisilvae]|uniref:Uncharacterized protein n=1 Tax=Chitinophaga solisilvae TaxID=1233460 RepID=A0A433WMD5_9BACT|nr:hypothetical protein [Chitinophaga solisilvae]NSL90637.1 hypothetical protein [Chitinophaga solisilvae]
MEHNTVENKNDITRDRVSRSRFMFYVQLFCIVAFMLGGCYNLYKHRYAGKPEVAVPESTLYNPKYK